MQITCPACRSSFTIPQVGVYTCPYCHGQVSIATPPPAAPGKNAKSRLGTGLAIGLGVLVVIPAIAASSGKRSRTESSSATAAERSEPAKATEASPSACDVAMPKLRAQCPRAGGFLERECQASQHPFNTMMSIDDVQPGSVIHFGVGPEWFLRDDGTLLTMNGAAASACDGLQDIPTFIGRATMANAPKRGNTPKTYEGVYDKDGEYLHSDCSEFEIRIGRLYYQALWEDPNSSEKAAERRANRAVKKAGVSTKVGEQIYFKTMSQCMQALTTK